MSARSASPAFSPADFDGDGDVDMDDIDRFEDCDSGPAIPLTFPGASAATSSAAGALQQLRLWRLQPRPSLQLLLQLPRLLRPPWLLQLQRTRLGLNLLSGFCSIFSLLSLSSFRTLCLKLHQACYAI